ncbi:MAG: hypothetical protein CFE41_09340 [Burkholderiales bacterium PBB2]|nr:MAG: hypothetical protein CFE41_09340 [Burkholderiales bacterium PBB2]
MDKRNLTWFAIGSLASSALSFISIPIIAWAFDDGDIGRAALLISCSGLSTLIFALGLDQSFTREFNESRDRSSLLMNAAAPGALTMFALAIVLMACAPTLLADIIFGLKSSSLSLYIIGYVFVVYTSRFLSLNLRMQEDGKRYAASLLIAKIGFVSIICIANITPKPKLQHLLIAHGVSVSAGFAYLLFCTKETWTKWRLNLFDRKLLGAMLHFGIPAATSGMLFWGLEGIDKFLLRSLSSYEELGVYSIALSISAIAAVATTMFTTVWIPMVYRWVAKEENLDRIDAVSRHALAVTVFIVGLAGAFSWTLQYVLPAKHLVVQKLIACCMLWPLCYALSETTGLGIAVARATRLSLLAAAAALAVNVCLNLLLLPRFGASGAAVALAAGIWVFLFFRSEVSHRIWRANPRLALYGWTLCALGLATLQALIDEQQSNWSTAAWLAFLLVATGFFRNSLRLGGNAVHSMLSHLRPPLS